VLSQYYRAAAMQINISHATIEKTARRLCDFYREEHDFQITTEAMKKSLMDYLDDKLESVIEEIPELLLSPDNDEHLYFKKYLPPGTIYQGFSPFSFDKFAALVKYFLRRPNKTLSKTKLNKLAFYSDFLNFKRTGKSITGSEYRHLPFGPVVDDYESLIERLEVGGYIQLSSRKTSFGEKQMLMDGTHQAIELGFSESETLEEVELLFGDLTAAEISEVSHREIAYRQTKEGELINYQFANLMNHERKSDISNS
jgi:hypothetical protein